MHNDGTVSGSHSTLRGSLAYIVTMITAIWGKEARYSLSTWAWFYWVTPSIHGDRFVCILPMQPLAQSTFKCCSLCGDIVWEQVCSEGGISFRRAQEVAGTGIEWWVREMAVLTQAYVHVMLHLPTNRVWLLLRTKHITMSCYVYNACMGSLVKHSA